MYQDIRGTEKNVTAQRCAKRGELGAISTPVRIYICEGHSFRNIISLF